MSRRLAALALLLALPGAVFPWTEPARADSMMVMSATLPTARLGTSAVWGGQNAYIFGGDGGGGGSLSYLNQIVRYNPATDTAVLVPALLPTGRTSTSAVWDPQDQPLGGCLGGCAYVFGGSAGTSLSNQIVRYNPANNTITVMGAVLPTERGRTSAVWDGQNAYIFGGHGGSEAPLSQILKYDPTTDTMTVMAATLPTGRFGASAVWDGQNAFIFGGHQGSSFSNEITRYNPATDVVTVMAATLPTARDVTSAVWDGQNAYIFGGRGLDEIVRYNPVTDTIAPMPLSLPTRRSSTSAVWDGQNAYIFGGFSQAGSGSPTDQIVRYNPLPVAAPRNLTASPRQGAGEITLNWQVGEAPHDDLVAGYKVYRSDASGGPYGHAATVGNALTFTDSGLPNGTWFYKVSAVNAAGEGPSSNEAGAILGDLPTAPLNLTATRGPGAGEITLEWQPPADTGGLSIRSYRIYRGTTSGTESFQAQVDGSATTYADSGLTPRARYYYHVSAVNDKGEGPPSQEASAPAALVPPSMDSDADGVPEFMESALCARQLVADMINRLAPALGRCESATQYTSPDTDDDGIHDSLEPILCQLEDQSTPVDGRCEDNNYDPPR